ncbi:MAG: DegT/DnrJ/EryC1/StrS aminotransferase family protein [Desulfuromonadales bacterium]
MDPFLPFTRPSLDDETIQGVVEVLNSGWLATGPKVADFEGALADYLGGDRIVRVFNSGTAALEVALALADVGPGDEVIVPAMTFAATANVVVRAGARPVFVDVELASRNLDLGLVEAALTPRTKAIMPVHFAGLPVAIEELYRFADRHGLRVVEDAAHAIGSACAKGRIGSFGDLVSFSFHPNKNMTTIEGGALSLADPALVERLEKLRFHGISRDAWGEMDVSVAGGKLNLADVSARIGLGQLKRLGEFNAQRRRLANRYFELLGEDPPGVLPERGDEGHSWHMFTLLLPFENLGVSRPAFQQAMKERNIGVGLHYPALHLFSLYRAMGYREGQFPQAERIGRETVTLPLFPAMTLADVDRVVGALREILAGL